LLFRSDGSADPRGYLAGERQITFGIHLRNRRLRMPEADLSRFQTELLPHLRRLRLPQLMAGARSGNLLRSPARLFLVPSFPRSNGKGHPAKERPLSSVQVEGPTSVVRLRSVAICSPVR
jgi:hypothetical protein